LRKNQIKTHKVLDCCQKNKYNQITLKVLWKK